MIRKIFLTLILLLIYSSAEGQTNTSFRFRKGTTLPSSCAKGDVFFQNSNSTFYGCTASNTWSSIAIGGSLSSYLPLAGGTMTGGILFSPTNTLDIGTNATTLAPRTIYAGTSFISPIGTFTTSATVAGFNVAKIIASGSSSMGTTTVNTGACSSVIDGGTAIGTLTTDTIVFTVNGDPTSSTGYAPSTSGGLNIWAYPTADHVNFKLCNDTAGNITPQAITLNWKVIR